MSKVVQRGIRIFSKQLRQYLYQPQNPTLCPALAMVAAGYQETIALAKPLPWRIANEPGTMYQDMFHIDPVPSYSQGLPIHIIRPDLPLKELGVDFTKATPDGLVAVYRHGKDKGLEFLSKWKLGVGSWELGGNRRVRTQAFLFSPHTHTDPTPPLPHSPTPHSPLPTPHSL